MRFYFPIAKVDGEARMVWGYASTEALDEQGETVRRSALEAALDDYMRFANVREMHQLSAVGKAREAGIDDKGLYIGARIVDPVAWEKVKEGVYNGFSIGGKVTGRDPSDRRVITALKLDEISLVDRPANPEAVFDCWKSLGDMMSEQPVQIWHCGIDGHRHLAKAEAVRCREARPPAAAAEIIAAVEGALARTEAAVAKAAEPPAGGHADDVLYADPGYQADGEKRYPIDSERHIRAAWLFIHRPHNAGRYTPQQLAQIEARIVAAWKDQIDPDGPPAARHDTAGPGGAMTKTLADAGQIARIILDLDWLKDRLAAEAAIEGDGSPQPTRLQQIVEELCAFLEALVAEETGEILDEAADPELAAATVVRAAGADAAARLGDSLLRKLGPQRAAAFLEALTRARPAERATAATAALLKTLADIVPRIDRLAKRVEDIAATPLPPLTIARGAPGLAKQQDTGGSPLSPDELALALARMSPEEQTMTLIKASHRNPIRLPG